jgi:hypothetical protein
MRPGPLLICAAFATFSPAPSHGAPVFIQQRKVRPPPRPAASDDDESDQPTPRARHVRTEEAEGGDVPSGMSQRKSRHFRIVYAGPARDFAQKAHYEQQVLDSLERAQGEVRSVLGRGREAPLDVVLYTSQEFRFHFGGRFGQGVLGFYEGRIRMNISEQIDARFHATASHEYVHAVIDEVAHRDVPAWVHEGLARWVERKIQGWPPANYAEKERMKELLAQGRLPSFQRMTNQSLVSLGDASGAAYAKSAAAVDVLTSGAGPGRLIRMLETMNRGAPFEKAFTGEFGPGRLEGLDDEVARHLHLR